MEPTNMVLGCVGCARQLQRNCLKLISLSLAQRENHIYTPIYVKYMFHF